MFNLQHFAIHNVSSAILYGAISIDLLVVRGNSLPAIRYEPHMKTSQSIAANCLFFVKKTKDNRTWVADQEPVNMKRLEP